MAAGNLNPFRQDRVAICSYQFARSKEPYLRQSDWDLVVIDEAHRLRNVYKPTSKIANAIKQALAPFPKVLLTATPLQNSLLELYGLVSVVDDFAFGDLKSFRAQFTRLSDQSDFDQLKARLQPICKRTLRRQVLEYIKYTSRHAIVQEFFPSEEEQRLYNLVTSYLQRPTLYALPASQRQLMTLILRKLLASSTYAISDTLEGLTTKLVAAANAATPVDTIPETLADNLEDLPEMQDEWTGDVDHDEDNEPDRESGTPVALKSQSARLAPEQLAELRNEIPILRECHELAKSITRNSKGEVLLSALRKGFAAAAGARQSQLPKGTSSRRAVGTTPTLQEKALIFTESRRTQEYLSTILEQTEFAGRIVLFNGTNNDPKSNQIYQQWRHRNAGTDKVTNSPGADKRAAIVEYFRDEAAIMIATEAAAEGINLQFCNLVVNYDLPWNPQRIEQRIGRCHRYGQKFDVVVVNFLNKSNAADQRVYELLDEKFRLFSGIFGASDEVLGAVESGIDFEKRIAGIIQKCRTPAQISREFDQLQLEFETEISAGQQEAREKLLNNFDQEVVEKVRVQSHVVLNRFNDHLWQLTRHMLADCANFDENRFSFDLSRNPYPGQSIRPGSYRLAKEVKDANLYRVGHPLAQQVIERAKLLPTPYAHLRFDYTGSGRNIAILQTLLGRRGHLTLARLTLEALDQAEDHLVFAGITDDGMVLDEDQLRRMFLLPATVYPENGHPPAILGEGLETASRSVIEAVTTRNAGYFEVERRKLDSWADDQVANSEKALKDTKLRIRDLRNEVGKAAALPDQIRLQEEISTLERRQRKLRQEIFDVEDQILAKRDQLVQGLRARLRQTESKESLFTIRWSLDTQ